MAAIKIRFFFLFAIELNWRQFEDRVIENRKKRPICRFVSAIFISLNTSCKWARRDLLLSIPSSMKFSPMKRVYFQVIWYWERMRCDDGDEVSVSVGLLVILTQKPKELKMLRERMQWAHNDEKCSVRTKFYSWFTLCEVKHCCGSCQCSVNFS